MLKITEGTDTGIRNLEITRVYNLVPRYYLLLIYTTRKQPGYITTETYEPEYDHVFSFFCCYPKYVRLIYKRILFKDKEEDKDKMKFVW